MKASLLAAVAAGALCVAAPAGAVLQISISDGINPVFTCKDGQLGCDLAGAAKNLLTLNTTVGNFIVFGTLSFSDAGKVNDLNLSSFGIRNEGTTDGTIKIVVSDTNFINPVTGIHESASLTFNNAVGSSASMLQFWADTTNTQGANPTNTPGALLDTVTGTPLTNPDSFSGSKFSSFLASAPFSMTEGAAINLIGGASITGFNEAMTSSSIPEARTWIMGVVGFGLLGLMGMKRAKAARYAI